MRTARKQQCSRVLRNTFGVSGFRPGQEQAADALLDGRDLLCILPTGAGKSLCWQLPALMMDELTVVISPLIVLMHDQVRHLRERGIPSVHLDSLMTPAERADALNQLTRGQAKIAFLAPERLNHPEIHALCQQRPPAMVVVDEAHCVVQWGDAFRPSYQQIGQFVSSLPRRPVLCAMTATADKQLQRGIVQSLGLRHPKRIVMPVERPNLHYSVLPTVHVTDAILRALQKIPGKAVVFCRLRARTESLAERLNRAGIPAAAYHAGLNREERSRVVQAYLSGRIRVVTATSAFGMGVDIPDIRLILHDHLPTNMIDYVQQSGRAGRDGETAYALPADSCAAQTPPIHAVRLDSARMATVPPRAALLSASTVPIAGNLRRIRSEKRALRELLGVPERRNRQGNPEYPADDSAGTVLLDFAAASG